jgi:hypothetical protein
MTDIPTPSEHDPLADALRRARSDVRPMTGDALVAAAREAKVARARRHRRATGGALGAVAAVLLVAVAAVALQGHSSSQVVKSGAREHDLGAMGASNSMAKIAPELVTVTPSIGLVDGQTVTVTARGFDAGTTVTILECTPTSSLGAPIAGPAGPPISTAVVRPDASIAPAEPGSDAGRPPTTNFDVAPWRCEPPAGPAGTPSASAIAVAPATPTSIPGRKTPNEAQTEQGIDALTTATATLSVSAYTDEFTSNVFRTGLASLSGEHPTSTSRSCVNPTGPTLPPPTALPGGPAETAPHTPGGRDVDPTFSEPPSPGTPTSDPSSGGTSSSGATPSGNSTSGTSSVDPSTNPGLGDEGTCVIIAMGTAGGGPAVYSSAPLSFGDTPAPPSTSVPPTSVPTTDPTSCPNKTPGTACAPAVDPPTSAPEMMGCPADPPAPSPMTGDHTSPLLDFTPTAITICHIPVQELGPPPVLVTDPATIGKITAAIEALHEVPDANTGCTAEMSDTMVLFAQAGSKRTRIVAELYGCGVVSNGTTIRLGAKSLAWVNALR